MSYISAARAMPVHTSEDGTQMVRTPEDDARSELSRQEAIMFLTCLTPAQVDHLEAMFDGWAQAMLGAEAVEADTLTDYLVVFGRDAV